VGKEILNLMISSILNVDAYGEQNEGRCAVRNVSELSVYS